MNCKHHPEREATHTVDIGGVPVCDECAEAERCNGLLVRESGDGKRATLQEMHDFAFGDLGFCGCGDPEGALTLVRDVLATIKARSDRNSGAESTHDDWVRHSKMLEKMIGMDVNRALAYSFLYMLDNLGLLEHGTNITGSWLTEKGNRILDGLRRYSIESIIENEADVLDAVVIAD